MPPAGYADPVTNDGPGFHSGIRNFVQAHPLELTEHVTRAIEASDANSTPLIMETADGATSICAHT
jgi:hypothetical protein